LDNYLTTEEIILSLKKNEAKNIADHKKQENKKKFKINKKLIFWSIVILAVLHLVFMGLPVVLKENTSSLLGYEYGVVFKKNQDTTGQLIGNVTRIEDVDPTLIEPGDDILVFGLYDVGDYYWQVEVVDIDINNQTLRATYDGIIKNTYTFDEVQGEIGDEANLVGMFYYTAATPRGFIIMIFFHALIVYVAYFLLIQKKNKDQENEVLEDGEKA
jgi:hypothetical protein